MQAEHRFVVVLDHSDNDEGGTVVYADDLEFRCESYVAHKCQQWKKLGYIIHSTDDGFWAEGNRCMVSYRIVDTREVD